MKKMYASALEPLFLRTEHGNQMSPPEFKERLRKELGKFTESGEPILLTSRGSLFMDGSYLFSMSESMLDNLMLATNDADSMNVETIEAVADVINKTCHEVNDSGNKKTFHVVLHECVLASN